VQKVGVASLVKGTQLFAQQHGRAKSGVSSLVRKTTRACEKLAWLSLVKGTQLFAQQHGRAKSWRG
jgi:hypothetical protein